MSIDAEHNEIDAEKITAPEGAALHGGVGGVKVDAEGLGLNEDQQKCIDGMVSFEAALVGKIDKIQALPYPTRSEVQELAELTMSLEHNRQAQRDAQRGEWASTGAYSLEVFRNIIFPEIVEGRLSPDTRNYSKVERGVQAMKNIHEPTYSILKTEFEQVNAAIAEFKRQILEKMIATQSQLQADLIHAKQARQGDWLIDRQLQDLNPAIENAQAGRWAPLGEFIGSQMRDLLKHGMANPDLEDPFISGRLKELRVLSPDVARRLEIDIKYGRVRQESPLESLRIPGLERDVDEAPPSRSHYQGSSSLSDSLEKARKSRERIWKGSDPIIWGPF